MQLRLRGTVVYSDLEDWCDVGFHWNVKKDAGAVGIPDVEDENILVELEVVGCESVDPG